MSHRSRFRWTILSTALVFPLLAGAGRANAQRPLDPLTPEERQEAIRLATADGRVRQLAGPREFDVASVELLPVKPAATDVVDPMRLPPTPRQAEVLISVYQGEHTGIRVVVDLQRRALVTAARVERAPAVAGGRPVGVTVPFAPAEVALARAAAEASPGVRGFAGANYEVDYLPITAPDPDLCPSGRCLEVLFRRGDAYLTTTAVVEISTRTVRLRRPR